MALDPARIDQIERTTKHDVIAFLAHVGMSAPHGSAWISGGEQQFQK